MKKQNNKINKKVIAYSLVGLACIALVFFVDWVFIIPAILVVWLNQRILMNKNS